MSKTPKKTDAKTTGAKTTAPKLPASRTAEFLARAIEFSGKSQREIAREAGFPKPNVVSMMKLGHMPVPLDRAPALAAACHVDPVYFMRLILEEQHPAAWAAMVNTIGIPLTANEHEMVLLYRLACEGEGEGEDGGEIEIDASVAHAVLDALLGFTRGPTGTA